MRPDVLFVPGGMLSPSFTERSVRLRAALDDLRGMASVRVFAWPAFRRPTPAEPTWQIAAALLRDEMSDGCHLVVCGSGADLVITALSGDERPASIVCDGIGFTESSLRALGLSVLADTSSVHATQHEKLDRARGVVRAYFPNASEKEAAELAAVVDAERDWDYHVRFNRSWETLNLVLEAPDVRCPVLYLEPAGAQPGWTDMVDSARRFIPHLEYDQLQLWPEEETAEAGHEFAGKAIAFIERVEYERHGAG